MERTGEDERAYAAEFKEPGGRHSCPTLGRG
jgi:hypothetical protein